jgi:hypothetical protein
LGGNHLHNARIEKTQNGTGDIRDQAVSWIILLGAKYDTIAI